MSEFRTIDGWKCEERDGDRKVTCGKAKLILDSAELSIDLTGMGGLEFVPATVVAWLVKPLLRAQADAEERR